MPAPQLAHLSRKDDVTDAIQSQAMAPVRVETKETSALTLEKPKPLIVHPRDAFANLRDGPGTEFPIIERATAEQNYYVTDFDGDWFKVRPIKDGKRPSWVRNDMVEPIEPDLVDWAN
jgi:hypothetical protein